MESSLRLAVEEVQETNQPTRGEDGRFSARTKSRRVLSITIRTAVEGLKVEIVASPSLWGRLGWRHGRRGWATYEAKKDNVYLEVEVRDDKAGRGFRFQPIEVSIHPGAEDFQVEQELEAEEYGDDGTLFDSDND
jgi:hypothetical protein